MTRGVLILIARFTNYWTGSLNFEIASARELQTTTFEFLTRNATSLLATCNYFPSNYLALSIS